MKYKRFFIFDFETTGFDPKKENVIEMGAVVCDYNEETNKFEIVKQLDEFVKIDRMLTKEIVNLTHITDDMLNEKGISEKELFNIMNTYINEETLLFAYNAQFDMQFFLELYKRYNPSYKLNYDVIDVLAMYKDFYPYPHKLSSAIETFSVEVENTHRACDDCLATYYVLQNLIRRILVEHKSISTIFNKEFYLNYVNVFGYNPKYEVTNKLDTITYIKQYGGKKELFNYFNKKN